MTKKTNIHLLISFDYLRLGEYYDDVNSYKTPFNNLKLYLYDDFLDKPKLIMNDIIFRGSDVITNTMWCLCSSPNDIRWLVSRVYLQKIFVQGLQLRTSISFALYT